MGKQEKKNKDTAAGRLDAKSLRRILQVFGRHYKKHWKALLLAHLALIAGIAMEALGPWPLKLILDHLILDERLPVAFKFLRPMQKEDPQLLLVLLASAVFLIAMLEALFTFFNKYLVSSTGDRMNADIRERGFAHLQRFSLSFHESAQSGNLV